MNVTDEHFARIFRETFSGRNKARSLPKSCTPITRMNKLRKHFTQAVFTNTLREKSPSDGKKTFFRRRTSHRIPSVSRETAKKQEKPTLLDARSKETALHCLNSSSPERPKHYLSAHSITRLTVCSDRTLPVRIDHSLPNVPNTPYWCILTTLCRCVLSKPC